MGSLFLWAILLSCLSIPVAQGRGNTRLIPA